MSYPPSGYQQQQRQPQYPPPQYPPSAAAGYPPQQHQHYYPSGGQQQQPSGYPPQPYYNTSPAVPQQAPYHQQQPQPQPQPPPSHYAYEHQRQPRYGGSPQPTSVYPTYAAQAYPPLQPQASQDNFSVPAAASGAVPAPFHDSSQSARHNPRRNRRPAPTFRAVDLLHSHGVTDDQIARARIEHATRSLPLGSSTELFAKEYGGHGVRMFFEFVKFYALIYVLVVVLQIISYIVGTSSDDKGNDRFQRNSGPFYRGFFISQYEEDQTSQWITFNVLCIIVAFLVAPLYFFYVGRRWTHEEERLGVQGQTLTGVFDGVVRTDRIVRLTDEGYIDVSSYYRSFTETFLRRLVSFIVFAGLLVAQAVISVGLTQQEDERASFGVSLAVAIVAVVVDFLYNLTASYLTEFEKHQYNSQALRWLAVKLMMFRVANIMAVYGARNYKTQGCVYDIIGEQVLTLWLVEIVAVIPGTIVGNMVWHYKFQIYAKTFGVITSDDSSRPQFQLPREYLKMLYYGFLSYAGMVVFPLSVILGFIALMAQYWSAKFRLCKLCGNPLIVDSSQRYVVVVGLLLAAVAGLLTPNAGASFLLSGESKRAANSTCTMP